jgi:hypothetical protein
MALVIRVRWVVGRIGWDFLLVRNLDKEGLSHYYERVGQTAERIQVLPCI